MNNQNNIRKAIRKHLFECMDEMSMLESGQLMDEERIPNDEAKEFVRNKENFIGSHIWGEKIGSDYLVASYGEQFPLFIYDDRENKWYENGDDYMFNGESVEQTNEHRTMLKPSEDIHVKSLDWMISKLNSIKKSAGVNDLSHKSVEPGEKN